MKNDYSFHILVAVILAGVLTACFTSNTPVTTAEPPAATVTISSSN